MGADMQDDVAPQPSLRSRLRSLAASPALPDPGGGQTAQRFARLTSVSRQSLSLGRLFEGHADAVAILHEAGVVVPSGVGAVWASEDPDHRVTAARRDATLVLGGRKAFCSGASLVDWALVTARFGGDDVLALVDVGQVGVSPAARDWVGAGMAAADTRAVCFAAAPAVLVGAPHWYLDRAGFWHGAVGVAACWWGGAHGILTTMRRAVRDEPHALALLGEAEADGAAMAAVLADAAEQIDADPTDRDAAHLRALLVRAVIEQGSRRVLDHAALALGPRPLALDRDHSERVADLQVYLRQHHGRRDLASLGARCARAVEAPC